MKLFKSKIEILKSKIAEKIHLLDVSERNSEYKLQKLYDWQEDYDWVDFKDFKDNWIYCDRCGGYSEEQCICYSR